MNVKELRDRFDRIAGVLIGISVMLCLIGFMIILATLMADDNSKVVSYSPQFFWLIVSGIVLMWIGSLFLTYVLMLGHEDKE